MIPEWNSFINADCMEYLKEFPDNYFSLAIVDPPYGAGFTEGGGCKGWFTKYHQNAENVDFVERESTSLRDLHTTGSEEGSTGTNMRLTRTGGTWAEKYGKKLYRGTLPLEENTLSNSFASHETRLYGAVITLNFHRHDVLLSGRN